ncbi:MAG: hypothetical protein WC479_03085 [Candidatus Izemoplasmatales bacterium]
MFKPNIGSKDTVLPTENRYDEWVDKEAKKLFLKNQKRTQIRNKKYNDNKHL